MLRRRTKCILELFDTPAVHEIVGVISGLGYAFNRVRFVYLDGSLEQIRYRDLNSVS
jgi:hypothetical protein